jgi:hypothetical protein
VTLVCYCGGTEPCSSGYCRFVDVDAVVALNLWLAASESVRQTCGNLVEFDTLIAGQKKRLADLFGQGEPL